MPSPTASRSTGRAEETRKLDEPYRAAVTDGGKLVVHSGGDTPTQQYGTKAAFKVGSYAPRTPLDLADLVGPKRNSASDNRAAAVRRPPAGDFPTSPRSSGRPISAVIPAAPGMIGTVIPGATKEAARL
ncbi:hypothetical protein [Streptomyces lutosisoli]|uniref:Uncharacterized protein n=1 Tax=Streptomyces lutosisoli TaxID=2665721 RepID=A0ABW2W216_9ACTN